MSRQFWKVVSIFGVIAGIAAAAGQQSSPAAPQAPTGGQSRPSESETTAQGFPERPPAAGAQTAYTVPQGTRILLNMINSVSTRQAAVGDRVYLETAFPVSANGRITIPQGSWVTGTVTSVKRPGRAAGKGSLGIMFDSIVLPNGVSRNFNGDLASIDSRSDEKLKRENSTIKSGSDKSGDAGTVVRSTTTGTIVGSGIGAAAGHIGGGAGVGAASGAAIGLATILLTRGPEAVLTRGSVVEMVVDRPLQFSRDELDFSGAPPRPALAPGEQTTSGKPTNWTSRIPL